MICKILLSRGLFRKFHGLFFILKKGLDSFMTRGQISIITDRGLFTSIEFDGDMYVKDYGHGYEVLDGLRNVHSYDDYVAFVELFDEKNFGYKKYGDQMIYGKPCSALDMSQAFFVNWGSDYVYIKNLTDKPVEIIDSERTRVFVEAGSTAVFNFGKYYTDYDQNRRRSKDDFTISEANESPTHFTETTIVNGRRQEGFEITDELSITIRHRKGLDVMKALTDCLTEWFTTTVDGRKAWEVSMQDFNIGDLVHITVPVKLTHKYGFEILKEEPEVLTIDFDKVLGNGNAEN